MPVLYQQLQPHGDIGADQARENTEAYLDLKTPAFTEALTPLTVGIQYDQTTVAIIGNGPSLRGKPEVQQRLASGVGLDGKPMVRVAASGGLAFTNANGIVPDAFVVHLAGNDVYDLVAQSLNARPVEQLRTIYYVASAHSPPESPLFQLLRDKGAQTRVFHCYTGQNGAAIPPHKYAIGTGTGAPVAAMALFAAKGYKKFEIFGMGGGAGHAVEYGPDHQYPNGQTQEQYMAAMEADKVRIDIDGKIFELPAFVWDQALEIIDLLEIDRNLSVHFHGDPLFITIFNTPTGRPRHDFAIIDPRQSGPGPAPSP